MNAWHEKSPGRSCMDTPDLAGLFLGPLEAADRFTYMVSGSVASIEYGEPRATLDIDLVLLLEVAGSCRAFP